MKTITTRIFTGAEYYFSVIVSVEEFAELPRDEQKEISKRARISPIIVNRETFEPMVIVDNVAYIIEPHEDDTH